MSVGHYRGSCQCGAVAFEADVDISQPDGLQLLALPAARLAAGVHAARELRLLRGEDSADRVSVQQAPIRHQFCRTCGIESFAYGAMPDGTPMAAINVNCLDGVDPLALPTTLFDGRSA